MKRTSDDYKRCFVFGEQLTCTDLEVFVVVLFTQLFAKARRRELEKCVFRPLVPDIQSGAAAAAERSFSYLLPDT